MKTFLDGAGRHTTDGVTLLRRATALLGPVFEEYVKKGYPPDEIARQVHEAVDFIKRNRLFDRAAERDDEDE